MALWLCKQEPTCYSYDDLVRDGLTVWDGVSNPLARQHLRQMRPGDRVLFYHTGKEKAVVGEMVVAGEPKPDPNADDEAAVVVEMRPVRRFPMAVTLAQIKGEKRLANWDLVRNSRLSVVPVTENQWKLVEEMAGFPGKNRKLGGR
ncbi:MAG TPA: EVE domain-containing protein [Gemmataceae bacterium]|nr:EVE domain-containing protein [Gemmataceae bacterium]